MSSREIAYRRAYAALRTSHRQATGRTPTVFQILVFATAVLDRRAKYCRGTQTRLGAGPVTDATSGGDNQR